MRPSLRVDPTAPEAAPASDTYDPDNDPQRLLKLSHSLRYHLSQPLRKPTVQQNFPAPTPPGVPSSYSPRDPPVPQQPYGQPPLPAYQPQPPLQPTSLRIAPLHPYPPPSHASHHYPSGQWQPRPASSQQQPLQPSPSQPYASQSYAAQLGQGAAQDPDPPQLPPLKGPGTKSGPYSGFASKTWLQNEFQQDVDGLRRHVDEYASKREHRAFELERSALKAEIAHLRKRLEESQDKVGKLEMMMPDEDGEFKALKAELQELDKEADHFSDLYQQEARATRAALDGFRQAIADVTDIEAEFERIKHAIAQIPEPQQPVPGAAQQPFYDQQLQQQQHYAPAPEDVPPPRACCGCFGFGRK